MNNLHSINKYSQLTDRDINAIYAHMCLNPENTKNWSVIVYLNRNIDRVHFKYLQNKSVGCSLFYHNEWDRAGRPVFLDSLNIEIN